MTDPRRPFLVGTIAFVAAALPGCILGPAALKASRVHYNEVIQATTSEQLLLNLVRLQYREAPVFLEVGSVSAQFSFRETGDISGTINEGPTAFGPDRLGLGAAVAYEERPTVTFTPLQGGEFVKQMLAPVDLQVLVLLSRSGWSIDRVLRLGVQTMNGLDNASTSSGPTPARAPCYEKFARVCALFRELQSDGQLVLGYVTRLADFAQPIALGKVDLPGVVDAVDRGYRLVPTKEGGVALAARTAQALVWRIPSSSADRPAVREITELLGLRPGLTEYEIHSAVGGEPDTARVGGREQIDVATRSLMGALFYLSQAVHPPAKHRTEGLVTTTRTEAGRPFDWGLVTNGLLRIHSQALPPSHAAVRVRYRGYWYYIDDSDLTSKSTFGLLSQLFAMQAGEVEAAAPVLTLPVGG